MTTRGVGITIFSILAIAGGFSLYYIYKGEKVVEPVVEPQIKKKKRKYNG